jgi:signal transduction histidine kinase
MFRIAVVLLFLLFFISSCSKHSNENNAAIVNNHFAVIKSESIPDSIKLRHVDTLYNYLNSIENDSLNRELLFDVVREYFKLKQYESHLQSSKQLFQLALSKGDTLHMAKSLCYIGDYYENETHLDSAYKYYSKSENLYRIFNDTLGVGKLTLYKSGILYDAGIFTESEIQTSNALAYLIKTDNERLIYEAYNLMGLNLTELENYEKSFDYFTLALKQLLVLERNNYAPAKLIKSRAAIYNNLGNLFTNTSDFNKAISYYEKGLLSNDIKENHPKLYCMLLDNLATAKMKSGNLLGIEQLFKQSMHIRDSLDIKSGIVTGNIHLGEYYLAAKDTTKAVHYLTEGYEKAKDIKSTYDVKNALQLLSVTDTKTKTYFTPLYISITDSLQNIERNTRNKFARIAYETDQIEEKNESLVKKYTSTVLVFSCVLLLLTVIFIIFRLKSKNKELQFSKTQQESNEKIYQLILEQQNQNQKVRSDERNRIALELHDGIVNRIFTTRFNLMQLSSNQIEQKKLLVEELISAETEIRKISHDLQQNLTFEDQSFQVALKKLVASQSNQHQTIFDCSIDTYIDWTLIPSAHKVHVYRICQEILQNVNKYAQASKCFVMVLKRGTQIAVQITDNGIGFNTEKTKQGIGLKNIAERVKKIKGTLQITSNANGTTIEVLF